MDVESWEALQVERSVNGLCGWPLCSSPRPPSSPSARFRIRNGELLSAERSCRFCTERCRKLVEQVEGRLQSSGLPAWRRVPPPVPTLHDLLQRSGREEDIPLEERFSKLAL